MRPKLSNLRPDRATGIAPIAIGVSGHRFLSQDEIPVLTESVRAVLGSLERKFSGTPLFVVSALAQGADQLVAREALDRGWEHVAVLPMRVDRYRKTFTEGITGLDELLARSCVVRELGEGPANDERAYIGAGLEICAWSHTMIALWSGHQGRIGGTGQIVRSMISGCLSPLAQETESSRIESDFARFMFPRGRVYWISSTNDRPERPEHPGHEAGSIRIIDPCSPDSTGEPGSSVSGDDIDHHHLTHDVRSDRITLGAFNATIDRIIRDDREKLIRTIRSEGFESADLIGGEGLGVHVRGIDDPVTARWAVLYAAADLAAIRSQSRARKLFRAGLTLLIISVCAFEFTTGPVDPLWPLLGAYIALVALTNWVLGRACSRSDERHFAIRHIAEQARVKMHLSAAKINELELTKHLIPARDPEDWVSSSLRTLERLSHATDRADARPDHERASIMESLRHTWIAGQINYFTNRTTEEHARAQRFRKYAAVAGAISLGSTLAISIALLNNASLKDHHLTNWVLYASILLLFGSGLIKHVIHYRAYEEHENRYRVARERFVWADRRIRVYLNMGDLENARRELVEIGALALRENAEWFVLHQERPATPN